MFPFCRRDYVSADELFPKLEMPPFKVRLRLLNFYPYTADEGAPAIRSECSCRMPHSLFCESLGQLVFTYWFETIQEFIEEHVPIDPFPHCPIEDIIMCRCSLRKERNCNPLWGLQLLFCKRSVLENLSIGLTPTGYRILILPKYFSPRVKAACEQIQRNLSELKFTIKIECFPFDKFE